MAENQPFGVAFIGCGSYNSSLADAANRSPKLKPIACYDLSKPHADAFAEKLGLVSYGNVQEMLSRDDIQGVVIASPNNAHRENVEVVVSAGKHVFVDKPIANTIEDALAIIDATEKAGLILAVGHNGRRMPGHRKVKELIDAGAIGTPVTVEANFSHSGGLNLTPDQWRFYKDGCPGLPLMQLGVHFADTVQYLLGDIKEVSSFMSHIATPADNNDVTVSLLKFDNGLLGYLGSNYATPSVYYVNVYGTGGNIYCDGGHNVTYRKAGTNEREQIAVSEADSQIEELEEFANCALTGGRPEVDGRAALMALSVVRAAIKSNDEGRAISIEELIAEARS